MVRDGVGLCVIAPRAWPNAGSASSDPGPTSRLVISAAPAAVKPRGQTGLTRSRPLKTPPKPADFATEKTGVNLGQTWLPL